MESSEGVCNVVYEVVSVVKGYLDSVCVMVSRVFDDVKLFFL